jgi:L-Ala-D/L-Glu epimerase
VRRDRKKNQLNIKPNHSTSIDTDPDSDSVLDESMDFSADLLINREPISQDIISLRQLVLHPAGTVEKVLYKNDDNVFAGHFVIRKENEVVAVGTVLPEDESETLSYRAWRIRGMSVHPEFQGLGLGTLLLDEILDYVKNFKSPIESTQPLKSEMIWCNARVEALNLYTKCGFEVLGEEFIIPGSGPHKRLHLKL